jgi:hypothetical protein
MLSYFKTIWFSFNLESQFSSDESRLRRTLLDGYVPEARPVINTTTVTVVDIGLTIIQVMNLVSKIFHLNKSHVFLLIRMNKIK